MQEYVKSEDATVTYDFNDLALSFMFVRVYLLLRFSFYLTSFMNPRT